MRSIAHLLATVAGAGSAALIPATALAQSGTPLARPAVQTVPGRPRTPPPIRPKLELKNLPMAEQTRQQRRIDKCKANGGEWFIVVTPMSLTASGSDVDELYGTIWLTAGDVKKYQSSRQQVSEGGAVKRLNTDLWFSPENANVGRDGGRGLATITMTMRGQPDQRARSNMGEGVAIFFGVKDEDDGRGGSNDETFIVTRPNISYNAYRIATGMPSCEDSPNFSREARLTINTRSNGNNHLNLNVHVRWFRDTGM